MRTAPGRCAALLLGALALAGCAAAEAPEVERVVTVFEDPSEDAAERCALLVPKALERLEDSAGVPCAEAIAALPLEGGRVERVEVWGGDAQARLDGDTVFLRRTSSGWRIAAALCTPQPEGPYDCEVAVS